MTEDDRPETIEEAVREELLDLWADFDHARRFAAVNLDPLNDRSGWSIQMGYVADRIANLTPFVGSPSWEEIQVPLLLDGWWDAVHRRMGVEPPPFDRDRAQAVADRIAAGANTPILNAAKSDHP